jgi:hypothetical protein
VCVSIPRRDRDYATKNRFSFIKLAGLHERRRLAQQ